MPQVPTTELHYNMDIQVIPHYNSDRVEHVLNINELESLIRNTILSDLCYYYILTRILDQSENEGIFAIKIPEKKNTEFYENFLINCPNDISENFEEFYKPIAWYIRNQIAGTFSHRIPLFKRSLGDPKIKYETCISNLLYPYINLENSDFSFNYYLIENGKKIYIKDFNLRIINIVDHR